MDVLGLVLLVVGVALFGMLAGSGRTRDDVRMRRRWDSRFEWESRHSSQTDATGILMCRSCGTSASERAGCCPACGAVL